MEPVPWNRERERGEKKRKRERKRSRRTRRIGDLACTRLVCARARFNELGRISLVDNERRLGRVGSFTSLASISFQLESQVDSKIKNKYLILFGYPWRRNIRGQFLRFLRRRRHVGTSWIDSFSENGRDTRSTRSANRSIVTALLDRRISENNLPRRQPKCLDNAANVARVSRATNRFLKWRDTSTVGNRFFPKPTDLEGKKRRRNLFDR